MKILENRKITQIYLTLILMLALILGCVGAKQATEIDTNTVSEKDNISVTYRTHVENIGWQNWKKDGELAGTQAQALRLEAMDIKLNEKLGLKIKYQTHIQNIGWQEWKNDGEMAGTEGQGLRLEAIKIQLEQQENYSVMYRVHVQNIGWQEWKYDGELAGTEAQGLRLEAIEIKIVKKEEKGLVHIDTPINGTIYYSNENIKISGWKMSNVSNTKIKAYIDEEQIEDNQIKYTERKDVLSSISGYGTIKENPKPGFETYINTAKLASGEHTIKILLFSGDKAISGYLSKIKIDKTNIHVNYSTHVQNIGWQKYYTDGETAGTTGQGKKIESIKIKGINFPEGMTIKYKAHVQNIGWQDWKNSDEIAGTTGQDKRLEAIKIKLEGTSEYSIMYRVHVQSIGWQDWCYDEETAGTINASLRIEGIEIKIVPKISKKQSLLFIDNPTDITINEAGIIKGWLMTTEKNTNLKIFIDNQEINLSQLRRTERQDVLNSIKGYGNEEICNTMPGFELNIDYSKYSLGKHVILIQNFDEYGNILTQRDKQFTIKKRITHYKALYGITGLRAKGDNRGKDLEYYRYGDGPNVFFATFAIHGFEDLWHKDGSELVQIADDFYHRLVNDEDDNLASKWTIYIFPGVNLDGLNYGYTNNGPGRTSLYSEAPQNKGIDMNRCWQTSSSYTRYTSDRYYNGTSGFQAIETQYLRNFLLDNKSKNGQTVLVDLHGWTQQLIGDSGVCSYYSKQFPENDKSSVGRYGTGYLINWARTSLGSTSKAAKAALIELPNKGINGHQSVVNNNFANRYIEATLNMLRNI